MLYGWLAVGNEYCNNGGLSNLVVVIVMKKVWLVVVQVLTIDISGRTRMRKRRYGLGLISSVPY